MNGSTKLKIGDKLIDYSNIYRVFKIKKAKNQDGKSVKFIFFKPFFKKNSQSLVCSIPEDNIKEANLRRPVSKEKIIEAFSLLSKKPKKLNKITISEADLHYKENDPMENARLIRSLWLEKHDEDINFTSRKKNMYQNALLHLAEEMSIVQKINLEKAKKKIKSKLRSMSSK